MSPGAARVLLFLATFGLVGCLVLAFFLWRQGGVAPGGRLASLSPEERLALVEDLMAVSPGLYVPAWFEPRVGYTLLPGQELTAWGGTFRTNELGYRTGPPERSEGTFRVLFLGDSWTFGMGVAEAESFPRRFAELANRQLEASRTGKTPTDEARTVEAWTIEAWTLALPGYNLTNQLAALAFFGDRLRPDAVVLAPTPNDMDSTAAVLPNGSLGRVGLAHDDFGYGLNLRFPQPLVGSHLFRRRWAEQMAEVRELEERLAASETPLLLFFTGTWNEAFAHRLVAEAEIGAPYLVTPPPLTVGEWRNPPPVRHPSPRAHELYARMIYRGLGARLGWPELPPLDGEAGAGQESLVDRAPIHRAGERSAAEVAEDRRRLTAALERAGREIPESFTAGAEGAGEQLLGPLDPETGLMGRGTAVLVRRPGGGDSGDSSAGAAALEITLEPLADLPGFYPLTVTAEIPSPSGGSRRTVTVDGSGPGEAPRPTRLTLPIPGDLAPGSVLDLVVRAERTVAAPETLGGRSLLLRSVEPVAAGTERPSIEPDTVPEGPIP